MSLLTIQPDQADPTGRTEKRSRVGVMLAQLGIDFSCLTSSHMKMKWTNGIRVAQKASNQDCSLHIFTETCLHRISPDQTAALHRQKHVLANCVSVTDVWSNSHDEDVNPIAITARSMDI